MNPEVPGAVLDALVQDNSPLIRFVATGSRQARVIPSGNTQRALDRRAKDLRTGGPQTGRSPPASPPQSPQRRDQGNSAITTNPVTVTGTSRLDSHTSGGVPVPRNWDALSFQLPQSTVLRYGLLVRRDFRILRRKPEWRKKCQP
jgi:hypothetical protein